MSEAVSPELLELIAKVRASLKVVSGQLREIERAVAVLPQEVDQATFECPHCGPLPQVRSQRRLEEHLANVHAEGLDEARDITSTLKVFMDSLPNPERDRLAELFPAEEEVPSSRPAA